MKKQANTRRPKGKRANFRKPFVFPQAPTSGVHRLKDQIKIDQRIDIVVAGAGGNGCHIISGLVRIDRTLRLLGYPGLHVILYDPDTVSQANLGRQLFYDQEIGIHKAIALIQRWNSAYCDLRWGAVPEAYAGQPNTEGSIIGQINGSVSMTNYDFLITCVDSGEARRQIHNNIVDGHWGLTPHYWLDVGNETDSGQVCLGEFRCAWSNDTTNPYLPNMIERFPKYYDGSVPETNTPSCSAAEALTKQGLLVNNHVSAWALQILWDLLYHGEISICGASVDVARAVVAGWPVPVAKQNDDPDRLAPWQSVEPLARADDPEPARFLGNHDEMMLTHQTRFSLR